MLQRLLPCFHEHRLLAGGIAVSLALSAAFVALAVSALSAGEEEAPPVPTPLVYHDPAVLAAIEPQEEPATSTPVATVILDPDAKFAIDVVPEGSVPPEDGAAGEPTQPEPPSPVQPSPEQPQPTSPPAPTSPPPTEPLGISIVSPADGATVGATFTMQVAVSGIELGLEPGGALVPGLGHWHLGIDQNLEQQPRAAPTAQIGPLTPGEHTLTATLNLNDADATVVAIAQITVTVQ